MPAARQRQVSARPAYRAEDAVLPATYVQSAADAQLPSRSGLHEGQQVSVDRFGLRSRHAVRERFVRLQRPVPYEPGGQWSGVGVGDDLVIVAVHHQDRHRDLLEVLGEIGLGEGNDAVVFAFAPPIIPWRHQFSMIASDDSTPGRLKP